MHVGEANIELGLRQEYSEEDIEEMCNELEISEEDLEEELEKLFIEVFEDETNDEERERLEVNVSLEEVESE